MTTQNIEMTKEQLIELAEIRTALIELYNSKEVPDFTLIRKVDNMVEQLSK